MSKSVGSAGGARRTVIFVATLALVLLWAHAGSGGSLAAFEANVPAADAGDSRSDAAVVAVCDLVDDHALPSLLHVAAPAPLVFSLCCSRLLRAGWSLPPAVRPPISVA